MVSMEISSPLMGGTEVNPGNVTLLLPEYIITITIIIVTTARYKKYL